MMKSMAVDFVGTRVTASAEVRSGHPIIRGTRITVSDILGWPRAGLSKEEVLSDYPELQQDDINAALQYGYRLRDKASS